MTDVDADAGAVADIDAVAPGADEATSGIGRFRPTFDLASLPTWAFALAVVVSGLLILFHYGAYHWFLRDEWEFLAVRGSSRISDLMKPNGGAHWVLVPRLVYLVLWKLFGMRTYFPYQLGVVALHLGVAVLLRVATRRAGVGPWLATAAAGLLLLFGPGAQDIVWAFQIGFTGSIAYGLAQLLLADHDGGLDRRDLIGFGFGILAITSSGVGVTTTAVVGLAVLLRRGLKPALVHAVPLLGAYLVWSKAEHVKTAPFGRPSLHVMLNWERSSALGTFMGIGHFAVVAWLLVAVLVGGAVVTVLAWRAGDEDLRALRTRLSLPVALFAGALFFVTTTGIGRSWTGDQGARASRYVYLEAAFMLPILAVAAQALARRWRVLTPALVVLFLLPIAFNVEAFTPPVFGKAYMDNRRYILTTAVRMPFAGDVPADVQPIPDPYSSTAVNIGFLRNAAYNGQLTPSKVPLTPLVVNEFRIRLGLAQRPGVGFPSGCETITGTRDIDPARKQRIVIGGPVTVTTYDRTGRTSPLVDFAPLQGGTRLTAELAGLHLRFGPARGAKTFVLCATG